MYYGREESQILSRASEPRMAAQLSDEHLLRACHRPEGIAIIILIAHHESELRNDRGIMYFCISRVYKSREGKKMTSYIVLLSHQPTSTANLALMAESAVLVGCWLKRTM